jgi:hypothetical protein
VVGLGAKRCRDNVLFCLAHICPPPSSTGNITSRHLRQGEIFWKVVRHCPPQDGPPQTILRYTPDPSKQLAHITLVSNHQVRHLE